MKAKLSDIIEAIEFTDQYSHYFLDKTTGEVVLVSDMGMTAKEQEEVYDTLDEHGFYRLPKQRDLNDYRTMKDFIDSLSPGMARDRLGRAIEGPGAFRRFKDEVRRLRIEDLWYSYEADATEENGIEYE